MREWISREEEAGFPSFHSFQEAWNFLIGKYDRDVMLESVEDIDGEKCCFCSLIADWDAYRELVRMMGAGRRVVGDKYLMCRQPIQIFEDGRVHVVH